MNEKVYYYDKTIQAGEKVRKSVPEKRFCKYCGGSVDADSVFCPSCGRQIVLIRNENISSDRIFVNNTTVNNTVNNINYNNINMGAGQTESRSQTPPPPTYVPVPYGKRNDKWIAFLLCLLLGPVGAHKFYEGHTGMGILYLLTGGLLGLGWLADIFIILGKSDPYWTR